MLFMHVLCFIHIMLTTDLAFADTASSEIFATDWSWRMEWWLRRCPPAQTLRRLPAWPMPMTSLWLSPKAMIL